MFINFYADWCRFSNLLAPEWDKTAEKAAQEFAPDQKIVVAKIDCDKESECIFFPASPNLFRARKMCQDSGASF